MERLGEAAEGLVVEGFVAEEKHFKVNMLRDAEPV